MGDSTRLLIYLAEKSALYKQIELSTINISKETNISQQTISRKLIELEEKDLIERVASTRGIKLSIKEKGIEVLKKQYLQLRNIFEEKVQSFTGIVESGIGEGAYYVSMKQYQEQFKKKLGFTAYKGTLNVSIDYTSFLRFITSQNKIIIDGFRSENRTFGSIVAYKIKVNNVEAAIVIPERTTHNRDTIEIISPFYLRNKLNLKDGDKINITN
jgi:riboflavin kinase